MSEPKFTPGPWHQREHHTFAQFDIYADVNQFGDEDSFNHVAEIRIDEFNDPIDEEQRYKYGPTLSANADLITAAPEMYELLEKNIELLVYARSKISVFDSILRNELEDRIDETKNLLKKARGEK